MRWGASKPKSGGGSRDNSLLVVVLGKALASKGKRPKRPCCASAREIGPTCAGKPTLRLYRFRPDSAIMLLGGRPLGWAVGWPQMAIAAVFTVIISPPRSVPSLAT